MTKVLRAEFLGALTGAAFAPALEPRGARAAQPHARRRVRMGVNYVPSRTWWYAWDDWHPDSIRRDLEDVAAIGFDHIRIHLIWPVFQPNAAYVSEEKLDRLAALLDIADAFALDVEVTVLDGQLSGFLFIPAWLIDNQTGAVHNFMTSPALIDAQRSLFVAIARRIGKHPRFMGFDLANEIYWATIPLHLAVTPAQGDAWMRALLETCEREAPGKMHVNGVDKYPLESDEEQIFSRRALADSGAAAVTHPWEGFGDVPGGLFRQYGPLSVEATHFTEFLILYIQAHALAPRRPVWIEEFGCSKAWVDERLIPDWASACIANAATCDGLFGMTWWCSHDPSRRFTGMNALEYDLGLYTNDRVRKAIGTRLQSLIAAFDMHPPATLERRSALVIPDGAGADSVVSSFMRLVKEGVRPQIVLEGRAGDARYLRERGIEELIHPSKVQPR